jgi:hypothetical protein
MTQTITTANIYLLQTKFDEVAIRTMTELDIDKETFAHLCLEWIRQTAKWDNHPNTTDKKQDPEPIFKSSDFDL